MTVKVCQQPFLDHLEDFVPLRIEYLVNSDEPSLLDASRVIGRVLFYPPAPPKALKDFLTRIYWSAIMSKYTARPFPSQKLAPWAGVKVACTSCG